MKDDGVRPGNGNGKPSDLRFRASPFEDPLPFVGTYADLSKLLLIVPSANTALVKERSRADMHRAEETRRWQHCTRVIKNPPTNEFV